MMKEDLQSSLDEFALDSIHQNQVIDDYLMRFCVKMKKLVYQYESHGYAAMSSFLAPVLVDFQKFQEEWQQEREKASKNS